jgi:enoyl-[acyl-carrier protein] reductase III
MNAGAPDGLRGINALITGGTRGIGRAIAEALAAAGAGTLITNYLQNEEAAGHTRARCEALGARCIPVRANVLSPDEIDRLFAAAAREVTELQCFVHCAALNAFKPLTNIKPNQWDITMNISTRAFLLCAQRCLPLMRAGAIIAVSSLGARRVLPNYGALGPAKAALECAVRYLAAELAPRGIRVNGVTAGPVDTESIRMFPGADALIAEAVARTPAGRLGQPDDIADVVLFLAGDAARWIHGHIIVADGGLSLA